MKKGSIFLAIVMAFLVGSAAVAGAQSLGDLARKEKERREKIKQQVKVLTNDSASQYEGGAVTTGTIPKPAAADDSGKPSEKPSAKSKEPDEPTDFQGRTESFWRQTFLDARKRVTDLENEANVITLRIADLQNRFYAESDGFKQQEIQREIQKSFYEQDQNKENLAKARQQLADLETEARKSGALPGWITPRPE